MGVKTSKKKRNTNFFTDNGKKEDQKKKEREKDVEYWVKGICIISVVVIILPNSCLFLHAFPGF